MVLLPGGQPVSSLVARPWQLANLRMLWFAWALRRRLPATTTVHRVRYRLRGWNAPDLDPVRDAATALDALVADSSEPVRVVLAGHSMGGRVAAALAARPEVIGIVALAPWWPADDADAIGPDVRLLAVHGTADTWTDPRSSRRQCLRAAQRGVNARWIGLPDSGHFMLHRASTWHRITAEFVTELPVTPPDLERRRARTPLSLFRRDR